MDNQIKSFEEACKALNIATTLPDVSALPEKHQKAITAHYQLVIIAQALNAGWEPDWNDGTWKYYPWFDLETYGDAPAGSGFSYRGFDRVGSGSGVGSRLAYKSSELAEYAGTQFIDLYRDYFLIPR